MQTYIFINEKSGGVSSHGVEHCISTIKQTLPETPFETVVASGDPTAMIEKAAALSKSKAPARILLLAGDGTAGAIASAIVDSEIEFTPLPGGTMNILSRDLGFAPDLMPAITQLKEMRSYPIDVAYINERAFLNNVVFGAYSDAARSRERLRDLENLSEKAEAAADLVGSIAMSDVERYRITVEGDTTVIDTNTLMVANNCYDGAEELAPRRSVLDAGCLGLYIARAESPVDFLIVLLETVTGGLQDSELIELRKCNQCSISTDGPELIATVDGEIVRLSSPATIKIKPRALRVLAPIA